MICHPMIKKSSENTCSCNNVNTKIKNSFHQEVFYKADCMVCNEEIIYDNTEINKICHYCGKEVLTNSFCKNGHFVCDQCHKSDSIEIIKKICTNSTETDAAILMQEIRSHNSFKIHGPEHHSLVPVIILTVLKNCGYPINANHINTAIQRGQTITGGACAFLGACGAAIGVGIAYSIILEANPYEGKKRQAVQQATAKVLEAIASYTAARCCQRDSWIALDTCSKIIKENMGLYFPVSSIICNQYEQNKECIHDKCPLFVKKNEASEIVYKTWSICPICRKRIPAQRINVGNEVFIKKACVDHGSFESIVWRGFTDFNEWIGSSEPIVPRDLNCIDDCGICSEHLQKTCCVLINITDRCNLNCKFCLANQENSGIEPSLDDIRNTLKKIIEKDKTLVQLSGGEPTTRDDLPQIIEMAKDLGAKYVQLNSNGIRLAEDVEFVRQLAKAGLSFVFMQFDGTHEAIYLKLRNRQLFEIKQKAIENCSRFNIGVTLVPTLVRDVNINNIGEIIRYSISQSPKVRGVHFQPVSYLGRIPKLPENKDRITLDELVHEICLQSDGLINEENLLPSSCDHPLCGFHGDFIVDRETLFPLLKRENKGKNKCCDTIAAEKNREFVARRWERPEMINVNENDCCGSIHDMDIFLGKVKSNGFTITAMSFQDAGNLDFSRLQNCSFHVFNDGKLIPFCAYYLTPWTQ